MFTYEREAGVPRKRHNKCQSCGGTFFSDAAYKAHMVPVTDGRVSIKQLEGHPYRVPPNKVWLMEHAGQGGSGLVTVRHMRTRCGDQA